MGDGENSLGETGRYMHPHLAVLIKNMHSLSLSHTHAHRHANPPVYILSSLPSVGAHSDTWPPTGSLGNLWVVDCLQIITACFSTRLNAISCSLTPH